MEGRGCASTLMVTLCAAGLLSQLSAKNSWLSWRTAHIPSHIGRVPQPERTPKTALEEGLEYGREWEKPMCRRGSVENVEHYHNFSHLTKHTVHRKEGWELKLQLRDASSSFSAPLPWIPPQMEGENLLRDCFLSCRVGRGADGNAAPGALLFLSLFQVFVEYANAGDSKAAQKMLTGKIFDGKFVVATFYPLSAYKRGYLYQNLL